MAQRIRTIGGTGASTVAPPPSTVTAAQVVWGPNFGESTEMVEALSLVASGVVAETTRTMTREELIRLYSQQATYELGIEASIRRNIALDVPAPPLTQEHTMARTVTAFTSADLIHEAALISAPVAVDEGSVVTDETMTLANQDPAFAITAETVKRMAELLYTNIRPVQEGAIAGSFEAQFYASGQWVVPTGVTTYTGVAIASGGAGGQGGAINAGAGGGGGGASVTTGMNATPGTTVTIVIGGPTGAGSGAKSWIASSGSTGVLARPGTGGGDNGGVPGPGGSTATAVGTLKFAGGNGADNNGGTGGGGGGGAGSSGAGSPGVSTVGGAGGDGGGGRGGDAGNAANPGDAGLPAGGGGGAGGAGGGGRGPSARGQASVIFPVV